MAEVGQIEKRENWEVEVGAGAEVEVLIIGPADKTMPFLPIICISPYAAVHFCCSSFLLLFICRPS
jgi:hypothetical protein